MSTPDTWPFQLGGTNMTVAFDYDASGNQIYVGWVQPGTSKSRQGWRIMKQVFNTSNQLTDVLWPSDSPSFNFIWNNRSLYAYTATTTSVYPALILTSSDTTRWAITVQVGTGNLVTTAQASGPDGAYAPATFVLQDTNGAFWTVTIRASGSLVTTIGGSSASALNSLPLLDSNNVTWLLTVSRTGNLTTT